MMDTRGCASLTPGYMPRLRLGLTCFACHRHNILLGVCDTPLQVHENHRRNGRPKDVTPEAGCRRDLAVGER